MADEADRASDQAEEILRRAILHTAQQKPQVEATGKCLNCGVKVRKGMRWCDHDCMSDWQKRTERK